MSHAGRHRGVDHFGYSPVASKSLLAGNPDGTPDPGIVDRTPERDVTDETGVVMPGLFQKVSDFLKSPQGRKYTDQAKRYASDPKNRAKAQEVLNRFRGKR